MSSLSFQKVMCTDPSQYQEFFFNFESQSISLGDSNFKYISASQLLYPQRGVFGIFHQAEKLFVGPYLNLGG